MPENLGRLIRWIGGSDGHNRTLIVRHQSKVIGAMIAFWSDHNRAWSWPQSRGDRAMIVDLSFDVDCAVQWRSHGHFTIARLMKIECSQSFHVSPGKPSITSLKAPINAGVGYVDLVYSHPRDGRIAISSDAHRDATLPAY